MNKIKEFFSWKSSINLYICLAILSGILILLADFPAAIAPLAFVAVLPIAYVAYRAKPLTTFLLTVLATEIGALGIYRTFAFTTKFGLGMYINITIIGFFLCLAYGGVYAYASWVRPRISKLLWILIIPSGTIIIELLSRLFSPNGDWGAFAGAVLGGTPWVLALSSLGGIGLITFLVRIVAVTAALWLAEEDIRKAWAPVTVTTVLLVVCIIYGSVYSAGPLIWKEGRGGPLVTPPAYDRSVRVAAFVAPPPDEKKLWSTIQKQGGNIPTEPTLNQMKNYEVFIRRAAADGAKIISGPEYGIFVPGSFINQFTTWEQNLAKEVKSTIVIGYIDKKEKLGNHLLIATPDGRLYDLQKTHPVPGVESYLAPWPVEAPVIDLGDMRISANICFDSDFPSDIRRMAQKGVDLYVVPSCDWWENNTQHQYQTSFRGPENGMAILRSNKRGISSIVSPYGEVLAKATQDKNLQTYIIADVPLKNSSGTLYTVAGDWIVYVGAIILGVTVVLGIIRRKRKSETAQ